MGNITIISGRSGSGKTKYLVDCIKRSSEEDKYKRIFVITPEQFTHSFEKLLLSKLGGGMMFTEVLSFSRLSHRIAGELGGNGSIIMDEAGRAMLVRHLIDENASELKFFKSNALSTGYIDEIKSFISELMQYNISPSDLDEVLEHYLKDDALRRSLFLRLSDIKLIYEKSLEYMKEKDLTTTDGIISLAAGLLCDAKSSFLDGADIYLDGFTGFEPLQYKLLEELVKRCDNIYVTITIDNVNLIGRNTRKLFSLSLDTRRALEKMAPCTEIKLDETDETLPRYKNASDLAALEKGIFRSHYERYKGKTEHISLHLMRNPKEEAEMAVSEIKRIMIDEASSDIHYNEIAVITGDMSVYGPLLGDIMDRTGIPHFIDEKKNLTRESLPIFLVSFIQMIVSDMEYSAVMKVLRSRHISEFMGTTGSTEYQLLTDIIDNFLFGTGLRGMSSWKKEWVLEKYIEDTELQHDVNSLREEFLCSVSSYYDTLKSGKHSAGAFADILSEILSKCTADKKIINAIEVVLDDMKKLLGDEEAETAELLEIFENGLSTCAVGSLPGEDVVIVGDFSRTRLSDIRFLFLLGVNDCNIPKENAGGGIINDYEREFLTDIDLSDGRKLRLAPSPEDRMAEDEFHLYMNITKASERIYVVYSQLDKDSKKLRPAYLINRIKGIIPLLKAYTEEEDKESGFRRIVRSVGYDRGMTHILTGIQNEKENLGFLNDNEYKALLRFYTEELGKEKLISELREKGLYSDRLEELPEDMIAELYTLTDKEGNTYLSRLSVSQLEMIASCPYKYFMNYGLGLKERKEHSLTSIDIGNIIHESLDRLSKDMKKDGKGWKDYKENDAEYEKKAGDIFDSVVAGYKEKLGEKSGRTENILKRYKGTFIRTVKILRDQMIMGSYETYSTEEKYNLQRPVRIEGKIDRIDTAEGKAFVFDKDGKPEVKDCTYVKVMDYKTGKHRVDPVQLYYGVQLQTVVYLKAAVESVKLEENKKGRGERLVIPAGVFYYNINDRFYSPDDVDGDDENSRVLKDQRPEGIYDSAVSSVKAYDEKMVFTSVKDNGEILETYMPGEESGAIKLKIKTGGDIDSSCKNYARTAEEIADIIKYSSLRMGELSDQRKKGFIKTNPYSERNQSGSLGTDVCTYCSFHEICAFDPVKEKGNCVRKENDDVMYQKIHDRIQGKD